MSQKCFRDINKKMYCFILSNFVFSKFSVNVASANENLLAIFCALKDPCFVFPFWALKMHPMMHYEGERKVCVTAFKRKIKKISTTMKIDFDPRFKIYSKFSALK